MPTVFWVIALCSLLSNAIVTNREVAATTVSVASESRQQKPAVRTITVKARRYAFDPARIEVNYGDIVKITLIAVDVPHSFTIAEYRICKRVLPGEPVQLQFYADKRGTFVYYCNLTDDERCSEMRGELVVR